MRAKRKSVATEVKQLESPGKKGVFQSVVPAKGEKVHIRFKKKKTQPRNPAEGGLGKLKKKGLSEGVASKTYPRGG